MARAAGVYTIYIGVSVVTGAGGLREYYGCAVGILLAIQLYSQKVNLTIDGGMASQMLVLRNQTPSCLHFCVAQ